MTETSPRLGSSSCCRTGSGRRDANTSPGSSNTGSRFTVANAAPVTRFVAPGPIEVVHASVASRFFMRAKPTAVNHRLLVTCLVVRQQVGVLVERLPDSGDVAVPEDPEAPFEEPLLDSVPLDVLRGEEPDERL